VRLRANLIASGQGCAADPERALALLRAAFPSDPQLALLAAMREPDLEPEILSEEPPVRFVRALFTADECAWLIALATPALRPSVIVDDRTGRPIPDPVRTSEGASRPRPARPMNAASRSISCATSRARSISRISTPCPAPPTSAAGLPSCI
jgi:hypothetical protein